MSEFPIKEKIEKQLDKNYNAPLSYTPKPNMRPSMLGSSCIRRIYYNFLRVKPDYGWTIPRIKNFERGEAYHDLVKRWMRQTFHMVDYLDPKTGKVPLHWKTKLPDPEFPVNDPELSIKNAKVDDVGILKGVKGLKDGLWLFEYKSINQKGFERYIVGSPKGEHLEQGMVYAFVFEQNLRDGVYDHIEDLVPFKEQGINGIIYIYLNRENDEDDWKEFHLGKEEEHFTRVVEKIVKTKDYRSQGILPPKTEDFCKWCEFRDKCAKEFNPK